MSPTRVRQAAVAELDLIDSIEGASFSADRFSRRNLRRMLNGGKTRFWVAEEGAYLALSLRQGSGVARIYSLASRPEARGKGLASALIDAARQHARAAGCRALRLEVRESNTAARRLYEREGFRLHKRKNAYYEDGETALQLEADLQGAGSSVAAETMRS
jgi:ribosomal protein S18 acetylase RimI-like enzyme